MNKTVLSLGLVAVILLGWVCTVSSFFNNEEKMTQEEIDKMAYYKEIGEEQRSLGAFGKAIECYENIISLDPSIENYLELCEVYLEAGRTSKYTDTLTTVTNVFPSDVRAYELLGQYYLDTNAFTDCKEITKLAIDNKIATQLIEDLYYTSAYKFDTYVCSLPSALRFYNGYSVVKKQMEITTEEDTESNTETDKEKDAEYSDVYYYINTSLKFEFGPYKYATSFTDTLAAVLNDSDTYYYINMDGDKYLSTSDNYKIAYSFCEGLAIVETNDGKFKYLSTDNKLQGGEFEYATLYKNGVAGVKHGGKWYIINPAGKQVENTKEYAEILYDEDNICSNSGVIFVSDGKDKGYYMIDLQGNRIGSDTYDEAKPFFDSGIAAVKKDGKWGFVNTNGKLIIDYQYEDAQSFGYDIGAVKVDGKWGFVAANNRMVIEPEYEDAKCFSADKLCPVMIDGKWSYLKIIA